MSTQFDGRCLSTRRVLFCASELTAPQTQEAIGVYAGKDCLKGSGLSKTRKASNIEATVKCENDRNNDHIKRRRKLYWLYIRTVNRCFGLHADCPNHAPLLSTNPHLYIVRLFVWGFSGMSVICHLCLYRT